MKRSDDFRSGSSLGSRWTFHAPGGGEAERVEFRDGGLRLQARGRGAEDTAPLTNVAGDRSYSISVKVELEGAATGVRIR
ncbi:hypothetical protein DM806_24235 [Sphingobium lactosutens]|uniref:hypothetical protein n=1 Tax=Sphingobium lactosutens TaxID=522773 RepID=UPI0015BC5977|nr:hypothetical protein [Sphingobium lactosutens]NWK98713.1 hypothetical protein [Sphingobium lactosutens]